MQIDRHTIVETLRERGELEKAARAERELPEKVDHEQHRDLLEQFGVNPREIRPSALPPAAGA